MRLSNEEIIKLLYEISKNEKYSLKIVDYIKEQSLENKALKLNLRVLVKGVEFYKYKPKYWKELLKIELLNIYDERIKVIRELEQKNLTVNEKIRLFVSTVGYSRRTYYRLREQLKI